MQDAIQRLRHLGTAVCRGWTRALEEMLRVDAVTLGVDRVSYWYLRDDPVSIVCELGYVHPKHLYERGAVLFERDCAAYLAEARRVQLIQVDDVRGDPRVEGLATYFRRRDVGALLDVPVFANGRQVGILCHEHVGGPRAWTERERELAMDMAQWLTIGLEHRGRTHAEEAERRARFLADVSDVLARALDPDTAQEQAVRLAIPTLGEIATLIGYDGSRAWRIRQIHQTAEGQRVLDELARRFGTELDRPGLGMQALRDGQSLLLPSADADALRDYGLEPDHVALFQALGVRSAMAIPIRDRAEITGVMTFASTERSYDREDLRFAEDYVRRIALLLSNAELYARAREAVHARDEFISLAAHELRTPLSSLALSTALLDKELPSGESRDARAVLETIRRQTRRLQRLSDLLGAASKSGEHARPSKVASVDLAALVREVAGDFDDAVSRARFDLHVSADTPVVIQGDPRELAVVVSNLLDNAIKFGRGAPVDVSVVARGEGARLTVRDHGVGVAEDQRTRLFRRFGRGVSARHFGGLGLGLHISSQIVDAHGGSIRTEAPADGGARFVVDLPGRVEPEEPT